MQHDFSFLEDSNIPYWQMRRILIDEMLFMINREELPYVSGISADSSKIINKYINDFDPDCAVGQIPAVLYMNKAASVGLEPNPHLFTHNMNNALDWFSDCLYPIYLSIYTGKTGHNYCLLFDLSGDIFEDVPKKKIRYITPISDEMPNGETFDRFIDTLCDEFYGQNGTVRRAHGENCHRANCCDAQYAMLKKIKNEFAHAKQSFNWNTCADS